MSDEKRVLTVGRLDGLTITPVQAADGGGFLHFTVESMPGLRLVIEIDAARELRDALLEIISAMGVPKRLRESTSPSETDVCVCGRSRGAEVHAPGAPNGHKFDLWVEE